MKQSMVRVKTEAPLKDIIWATIESAVKQLKERPPGKSGLIAFEVDGCKVECVVRSPEAKKVANEQNPRT